METKTLSLFDPKKWAFSCLSFVLLGVMLDFGMVSHTVFAKPKVVYEKRSNLKFDGAQIEGEIQNPGEFYFQHRPEEKFDSLVKRRKNFHREMMRDVVFSK